MNSKKEAPVSLSPLQFFFVPMWWMFLICFGLAGRGNLALFWTGLTLVYFIFHPDKLESPGPPKPWNSLTALFLIELLAASLVYSSLIAFLALTIGAADGASQTHQVFNFYMIVIGFFFLTGIAAVGVITYLFQNPHSVAFHVFIGLSLLLPTLMAAMVRNWIFENALEKFQHLVHIKSLILGLSVTFIVSTFPFMLGLFKKWRRRWQLHHSGSTLVENARTETAGRSVDDHMQS